MPNYRRHRLPLPVFVTLVTHHRMPCLAGDHAEGLLAAMRAVKLRHPYRHHAHVILPDHLHWLFGVMEGTDFSRIVAALKREFTWRMKERGMSGPFWQNRFHDHLIRDRADWDKHLDYIHYNPVKHGHCPRPEAWPYSSYHTWLARGAYPMGWGAGEPETITGMELE
jgi:putative transposase